MVNNRSGFRQSALRLMVAWLAIAVGATLLLLRYTDMPGLIPVYRDASGHAAVFAMKSVATVFRIPAMGAAQAAAITVMWRHARATQSTGWVRFWIYAALAAAAKTLIECVQWASLGTALARQPAALWFYAALLPVLVFLALAANLWRTRQLTTRAAAALEPQSILALCLCLGAWLAFATFPKWLDL